MARSFAAALAGAATTVMLLLSAPAVAAEDVRPAATEPTTRQVLARPPAAITLAFTWDIDPDQARIFVLNSKGENLTSAVPNVDGNNVWVDLDYSMGKGTYTVEYRVNGPKGAPVGGTYQFAVGSSGDWKNIKNPYWSGPEEQPEVFKGGDPNNPYDKDAKPEKQSEGSGLEVVREDGSVEYPEALDTPDPIKDETSGNSPWLIGGSAAGVVAIAAAGLWWWKRRNRTASTRGGRRAAR